MTQDKLTHLILQAPPEQSLFTSPKSGGPPAYLVPRERLPHGQKLFRRIEQAWEESVAERVVSYSTRSGIYLEFISDPGEPLITKSLDLPSKNIRLLNVREKEVVVIAPDNSRSTQIVTYATVYVPNEQRHLFSNKISEYLNRETKTNKPKNQALIQSIADIRKALLVDSFWVDRPETMPQDQGEWVEVWLKASDFVIADFDRLLTQAGIQSRNATLAFPERFVKVVLANRDQLAWINLHIDGIAEFRKAKTIAPFIIGMSNADQAEWAHDLASRVRVETASQSVICLLDTGVSFGHPLLSSVLSAEDCHSVDPSWISTEHQKHGSLMAGIAMYGDLTGALESSSPVYLRHRLESVVTMPPPPHQTRPDLWGAVTSQAISRAEIQGPNRQRCVCLAITADDTRDRGRPTSWSAQLDQLASGAEDGIQRLIVVSAGNVTATTTQAAQNYPNIQMDDSVHDPGQAWNALTIGAYTAMGSITNPNLAGFKPVAPVDCISPFTTTSVTWEDNLWPIKPELVLEGGNLAIDPAGFVTECDDLSVISTYHDPQSAHFYPFSMTSAATARLAWMAGHLQAEYPQLWPETFRGLLVHSATWPENLKKQFLSDEKKTSYKRLLSVCGYGVPDLQRALHSATNSLTLIAQQTIQPFEKNGSAGFRTRDMHLYELPWPTAVLRELPHETNVEMRVTLSYFIEPGPGEIGWRDRYRYASHGLRFEVNSPAESKEEFSARINKKARELEDGSYSTESTTDHWLLGQCRNRGSIHSDTWRGTAQELAQSNLIAVTPIVGWWRERNHLKRWDKTTRYSLIVSISTPDQNVDIYTPVAIKLAVPIPITISV